jgi:hypothetical protein
VDGCRTVNGRNGLSKKKLDDALGVDQELMSASDVRVPKDLDVRVRAYRLRSTSTRTTVLEITYEYDRGREGEMRLCSIITSITYYDSNGNLLFYNWVRYISNFKVLESAVKQSHALHFFPLLEYLATNCE